ncbi:hypothetical protein [Burkholderia dolosa]|uniref:hypothetical protein n=1 Tax=Burkholderia dolosa TaxID=152500 RepID=UPI00158FE44D|nr:hypothetical protein [Burkholderia dolosa]MBR8458047.1 hypothetical protein [Burkholderia dolosa]MBY4755052.1 hypothetical protein [Burkholderia dolosa]MDN7422936.1 hypothetical protein [Burkholderia dolosa]
MRSARNLDAELGYAERVVRVRSGGQLEEVARAVTGLPRDEAAFVGGGCSDAMGRKWRAGIAGDEPS